MTTPAPKRPLGKNSNSLQPEEIRRVMWYSPESTSTGTILHYIHCWLAGAFQSRCGGVQYDLGQVRAPVDVFWAPRDWAAGRKDIDDIVKQGGWLYSAAVSLMPVT